MIYGYYLADTDTLHGDSHFAVQAKAEFYERYRIPMAPAERFDGVSVWTATDGSVVRRLTYRGKGADL